MMWRNRPDLDSPSRAHRPQRENGCRGSAGGPDAPAPLPGAASVCNRMSAFYQRMALADTSLNPGEVVLPAAIGHHELPGDEPARRGAQKPRQVCDVLRFSRPSYQRALGDALKQPV